MLVETVDQSAHAVVPELDDATVQAGQDPWPPRVKAQALHAITLGLELCQHCDSLADPVRGCKSIPKELDRALRTVHNACFPTHQQYAGPQNLDEPQCSF